MQFQSDYRPEITAQSPCIGVCSTALGDDVCLGCHRTLDEITRWLLLSDEQRVQINRRISLAHKTDA
jgi:predicted Fe-S protein YdhL (DUF1289 family)